MIQLRPFNTLGAFRNEWLNAHHHFSFGGYHNADRMGLGNARSYAKLNLGLALLGLGGVGHRTAR